MHDLLIALAGGAIGAMLAGLAWFGLRLAAIPGDLASHDSQVRVLNEDLELWVFDTYRALKQDLVKIENDQARQGHIYSGSHGRARAEAKTQALHRWRDRRQKAERELESIKAKESWVHRMCRRAMGKPVQLELPAIENMEPVIEEFRQPVTKHGMPRIRVFDPTRFEMDDLLKLVEQSPLEPAEPPTFEYQDDGGGGRSTTIHNEPPRETGDLPGLSGAEEEPED